LGVVHAGSVVEVLQRTLLTNLPLLAA
jgi:hypothetical protein